MTVVFVPDPRLPNLRYELDVELVPHRAFSSVNVQFEAKEIFDILVADHIARTGRPVRQPDFFNVLVADHLAARGSDLPASLRRVTLDVPSSPSRSFGSPARA